MCLHLMLMAASYSSSEGPETPCIFEFGTTLAEADAINSGSIVPVYNPDKQGWTHTVDGSVAQTNIIAGAAGITAPLSAGIPIIAFDNNNNVALEYEVTLPAIPQPSAGLSVFLVQLAYIGDAESMAALIFYTGVQWEIRDSGFQLLEVLGASGTFTIGLDINIVAGTGVIITQAAAYPITHNLATEGSGATVGAGAGIIYSAPRPQDTGLVVGVEIKQESSEFVLTHAVGSLDFCSQTVLKE